MQTKYIKNFQRLFESTQLTDEAGVDSSKTRATDDFPKERIVVCDGTPKNETFLKSHVQFNKVRRKR